MRHEAEGFFAKQQADLGATNGYIEEMMNGQKVVKVFNHEKKSIEEFNELNDRLFNSSYNANKFANILMPINAQIGNISYVLCAIVGCIFALNNFLGFTIGKLVSFLTFNKSFTQPINQVSQQFNSIVMALAGADRIFKLLDEKPEVDDGYVTLVNVRKEGEKLVETEQKKQVCGHGSIPTVKQAKQSIVNSRVRLLWTMLTSVIQMIKSFFTILICTQNPVRRLRLSVQQVQAKQQSQTLLTDSMIFRTVKSVMTESISKKSKKGDLRRSLGIVLQDTHLFTDTVMENIRYGRLDATDEEVIAAAKLANADSFIRKLPDGYNTLLKGDGGNLSQGQRQMLAIARAAVADPPALILDEATSSIDTRTEKMVQDSMDKLMHGRTTFVIAHRLSTIKNSDCIMVLEKGRIIERGSHERLLEQKGRYYQLYTGKTA